VRGRERAAGRQQGGAFKLSSSLPSEGLGVVDGMGAPMPAPCSIQEEEDIQICSHPLV
jgi:hypothetical protein